jgi:hypothetical protein
MIQVFPAAFFFAPRMIQIIPVAFFFAPKMIQIIPVAFFFAARMIRIIPAAFFFAPDHDPDHPGRFLLCAKDDRSLFLALALPAADQVLPKEP